MQQPVSIRDRHRSERALRRLPRLQAFLAPTADSGLIDLPHRHRPEGLGPESEQDKTQTHRQGAPYMRHASTYGTL